ncbi:MAG: DL-endopeptidase inhibitor IseA family protein, partial [Pygmaiobacter sp.]
MKSIRLFCVLLMAALLLTACGAPVAGSSDSEGAASVPTSSSATSGAVSLPTFPQKEDDFSALSPEVQTLFQTALNLHYCFSLSAPEMDPAQTVSINEQEYQLVTDPRFPDYASFYRALTDVFTEDYIESELLSLDTFVSFEGKLYSCAGARGANITFVNAVAAVDSETADELKFHITAHFYDDYLPEGSRDSEKTVAYTLVMTQSGWRFSQ